MSGRDKPMSLFASAQWLVVVLMVVVVGSLAGCGGPPTTDPPVLHLGQDTCSACAMILSEERYAAAIVLIQDGQRKEYLFDDLGEMLAFTPPKSEQIRFWAHDAATLAWIDATKAWYVRSSEIETPMASGVVAYLDKSQAETVSKEKQGEVYDYTYIRQPVAGPIQKSIMKH